MLNDVLNISLVVYCAQCGQVRVECAYLTLVHLKILDRSDIVDFANHMLTIDIDSLERQTKGVSFSYCLASYSTHSCDKQKEKQSR